MSRPALKADFIRSQPRDMPLRELNRRSKRAGFGPVGSSYASKVRSTMPRTPAPAPKTNGHAYADGAHELDEIPQLNPGHPDQDQPGGIDETSELTEAQFRRMLVVLGTERARALLASFERSVT